MEKRNEKHKPWALILSGGGAKGIAHVGVLKGLEVLGLRPDIIVGTSIGAIIGGLYASGHNADWMIDFITREFKIEKHLQASDFMFGWMPFVMLAQGGTVIRNVITRRGADSGENILKLLSRLVGNKTFDQMKIPFYTNAVDLIKGNEVLLHEGSVAQAIRASMCFPGVFEPVHIDDKLLIDGGVLDNMPVWIARKFGYETTLAIDLEPFEPMPAECLKNSMDVLMRSYFINCNGNYHPPEDKPTLRIPIQSNLSEFEFTNFSEYIVRGENSILDREKEIMSMIRKKHFFGLI